MTNINEMSNKSNLFNWIIDNIEEGAIDESIDLIDIKEKTAAEGTSVGNLIKQIYKNVKVKNARSKSNWCKMTKRYFGIKWKINTPVVLDISTFGTHIPIDFVLLSKTLSCITIGHFNKTIINGLKVLTEAQLKLDQTWTLMVMGKKIDPVSLGVDKTFNLPSCFEIIRQLRYCNGVEEVDESMQNKDFLKEHVSKLFDENSEQIRYRSKLCQKVLPFKKSHKASASCVHCKCLEKAVIVKNFQLEETTKKPLNENLNSTNATCIRSNTDQDVILSTEDNNDMSEILTKIFPECSDKMKLFLMSQKMAIERNPHGRRWNRDIVRLCLTLWCRSPKGVSSFDKLKSNKNERILASHALQLVFLGSTGFRFPFAHFPASTASGHELYLLVWQSVNRLMNFGFKIMFVSTDGAQTNRDLFKLLMPEFSSAKPVTCSFNNIYSNDKISFIMDVSHVIKKIRNNILKSGSESQCKRHMKFEGNFIEWNHFKRAYSWDISTHPFPVHHKLSQDHFYLTSEAKMRNHLAEDVLNADMYHLMKLYQQTLGESGSMLNATVKLLSNTSVLIANFRDNRAITDLSDDRLRQNHDVMDFFIKWEKVFNWTQLSSKKKCYRLKNNNASVIPSRLNSDVIENVFCQQRTLHSGANTNPTYLGYCHAMNSVILGQTTVSRKSNTGGDTAQPPTQQNQVKSVLKEQSQTN
ncbi:unnamed protein product [Mytilus edulis]|uniref:Transposable element P transposase-like RNase H domain-containing protein n=1 Tax=Mytilus edulis TaxID=6550 RepID=A0A8S3RAV6_MYTED|nr:unnamed protein product [Mytilus edulis]